MRDAIQELIQYNEPKYNYVKLAEELAELLEVVIKKYVKPKEYYPNHDKLVEEAGDVIFRLKIICRMEDIAQKVNERIGIKSEKLLKYVDAGKYKGHV